MTDSLRVVLITDAYDQAPILFNELLRAWGHRLVGVVTGPGPRDRRTDTYLDIVRNTPPGIDVIITTHPTRLARMLAPLRPDVIWVGGFLRVLPQDVLDLPPLGVINTHGGVLPKYRGPNPFGWAFRNDEGEIGWTVHRMTAGIDEGPILATAKLPYGDDDDLESLFPSWLGLLPDLLGEAMQRVMAHDPGEPQDEGLAGYASAFEESWRNVDWSQPARTIHNQVRSWTGIRGMGDAAVGELLGERYLLRKTHLLPTETRKPAAPGTLIERNNDHLIVQCGDGPLEILKWEAAGSKEE